MSEEYKKLLQELSKTPYGKALKALIEEELRDIDTVEGVTSYDEIIGRQKAVGTLKKVFKFLGEDLGKPRGQKTNYS